MFKTKKLNFYFKYRRPYIFLVFSIWFYLNVKAQFSVTLKYKIPKCGGKKNTDTTAYFLLANKKWIVQYPSGKTDTLTTDINGKIKIPPKKGTYLIFEPWKYYKQFPPYFPEQFYNKQCIADWWKIPDFTIRVLSNKKYKLTPPYLITYCPDKHPCLRTDTIIPHIPRN